MASDYNKQACVCDHGKSIHHTRSMNGKLQSPCNSPGCKCKDYKPVKG
jgi:hypothetical protein